MLSAEDICGFGMRSDRTADERLASHTGSLCGH